MNGTIGNELDNLVRKGVDEATYGSKARARLIFQEIVERDPTNENALLWLAYLTEDAYVAVQILEGVVSRNPRNELALAYLGQARARVAELEQLVSHSTTYSSWNRINNGPETGMAVPLLGEYLLRQGLITQQQLEMALRRHHDLARRGTPKQIGQVMIELGYLTQAQLDSWLQAQSGDFSLRFRD